MIRWRSGGCLQYVEQGEEASKRPAGGTPKLSSSVELLRAGNLAAEEHVRSGSKLAKDKYSIMRHVMFWSKVFGTEGAQRLTTLQNAPGLPMIRKTTLHLRQGDRTWHNLPLVRSTVEAYHVQCAPKPTFWSANTYGSCDWPRFTSNTLRFWMRPLMRTVMYGSCSVRRTWKPAEVEVSLPLLTIISSNLEWGWMPRTRRAKWRRQGGGYARDRSRAILLHAEAIVRRGCLRSAPRSRHQSVNTTSPIVDALIETASRFIKLPTQLTKAVTESFTKVFSTSLTISSNYCRRPSGATPISYSPLRIAPGAIPSAIYVERRHRFVHRHQKHSPPTSIVSEVLLYPLRPASWWDSQGALHDGMRRELNADEVSNIEKVLWQGLLLLPNISINFCHMCLLGATVPLSRSMLIGGKRRASCCMMSFLLLPRFTSRRAESQSLAGFGRHHSRPDLFEPLLVVALQCSFVCPRLVHWQMRQFQSVAS